MHKPYLFIYLFTWLEKYMIRRYGTVYDIIKLHEMVAKGLTRCSDSMN